MNILLREIKSEEMLSAFIIQKIGFIPIFLKYFDKVSPVLYTYSKFSSNSKKDNYKFYWIICDDKKVGELELGFKNDMVHISLIFILKKYQNRGIAQSVLNSIHNKYDKYSHWHLNTIKQEKRNCYLYEKLGYIPTGAEYKVNKRMSILEYERNT